MTEIVDLSILNNLDGVPLSLERLANAYKVLHPTEDSILKGVSILQGSENRQANSHSAILSLSYENGNQNLLFVKKIAARALHTKPWADKRRSLVYARTELRFYREFASFLLSKGVLLPKVADIDDNLDELLGNTTVAAISVEPSEQALYTGQIKIDDKNVK